MKDTKLRQLFIKIAKKSFHGENIRVKKNIHTNNKHYPAFCPLEQLDIMMALLLTID